MKITKFVHACLLVEMPEPVNRTVLFDPGVFSEESLRAHNFEFLDDIVITHSHQDHMQIPLIRWLVGKFPEVRILGPSDAVVQMTDAGLNAVTTPPEGMKLFDSPHEVIRPFFDADPPDEIGVHYLDKLSHPGDSHSFSETKDILALPVQAPWGSAVNAVKLALELKPKHVLPIHDWHWSDQARISSYDSMQELFAGRGITFHKLETGVPVIIE
jgi:L-ascorbate metabolism protein UlaG (beta-lactamase superfamily)